MLVRLAVLCLLLSGGIIAFRFSHLSRMRRLSGQRIGVHTQEATVGFLEGDALVGVASYPPRYYFAGPAAALLVGTGIYLFTKLPIPYPIAFGVLAGMLTYLWELRRRDMLIERVEQQLADATDQMVASLRAGSALLGALEATFREAQSPLREEFESIIGRIRIGEDPQEVVSDLPIRIPLESYRLFANSLLVHWQTGGSLASSLRTVGRTVRDRLEVSRRINAQAIESQVSVAAVMLIAYGVTAFTFASNPEPITKLVYSQIGSYVAAAVIGLQALGLFWIWQMSRIRF